MGDDMKDFITAIASVIILMIFVMQFAANQSYFTRVMGAEYAVREMRLISENQGMIKSKSIAEMKAKLSDILKCSVSEIDVHFSGIGTDKENSEEEAVSIDFDVTMPVYGIIGPYRILGIDAAENVRMHHSCGIIILEPAEDPEPAEEGEEQEQEHVAEADGK